MWFIYRETNEKVSGSSLKSEVVFGERFIKSVVMVHGSFTGKHEWKACMKCLYATIHQKGIVILKWDPKTKRRFQLA